jgi:pimeloyl-ACP methyl ester carboxylesterase
MTSTVTSRDGTVIAYERSGSGPPLVVVDGALCSRGFGAMPKLKPFLQRHFTLFAYDRRGRGESGDAQPYDKVREIEDLEAMLQAAGGSASVLGLSSGAALALDAAASGLNITKLAVYEPPYMVNDGGHHASAGHAARLRQLIAAQRRGEAVTYFMRQMVGIPAFVVFMMRWVPGLWSHCKSVAHTLAYDAEIMGDFSLPAQRLAAVNVPTLAINGEKSDVRLRDAVQALVSALPKVEHRVLKGQSHNVSPAALTPVLVQFFGKETGALQCASC